MKRLSIVAIGLALVAALVVCSAPLVRAQSVANIALPPPRGSVQLYPGCNNVALSFPDGTASQTVVQAVTPAGTVQAMWRHNAALAKFEGFSPAAPQASDLLTVNLWDAVWLCVAGASVPAPTPMPPPPPPPPPAPTGSAAWSGEWTAPTDFGQLGFTVNREGTAIIKFVIDAFEFECGPITTSGRATSEALDPALWPVDAGRFTAEFDLGAQTWTIGGEFDEAGSHASGTWEVDSAGAICSGAWESSR